MIKNYLKIALRNLSKRKFYVLIMVLGLAGGLTFSFFTLAYVWEEWQVNRHLRNVDSQFLVISKWKQANMGLNMTTLAPLAKALKEEYPHLVANYYRFDGITSVVANGDKIFRESIQIGDSTLLTMHGFPLLYGNPKTALNQSNAIVITKAKALTYFGKTNVLNETLSISSFSGAKQDFVITGILDDIAPNSVNNLLHNEENHFFMPTAAMTFFNRIPLDNWDNIYIPNYLELQEGVKKEDLLIPMNALVNKYAPPTIKENLELELVSLKDYYWENNQGMVKKMTYALVGVAFFILFMASVNFVNISVGYSASRLKEIGIRKLLGSAKRQLIYQFLTESVVLSLLAMVFSLLFYEIGRPLFGEVLGKNLLALSDFPIWAMSFPVGMSIFIGLLAGSYPAFVLSSHDSLSAIKGKWKSVRENLLFKRALIASQFGVAIFVFIGAIVISKQVNYFFSKDLGFNKEAILTFALPRDWTPKGVANMEAVRNELAQIPQVKQASISYEIPDGRHGFSANMYLASKDSTQAIATHFLQTDENYAEVYQLSMLAGQFFQNQYDSTHLVITEKAVKALGFKTAEEALAQPIKIQNDPRTYQIGGVVKDFHFESLHQEIAPMAFMNTKFTNFYRFMSIKLETKEVRNTVANIEQKLHTLLPTTPFEFTFVDSAVQKLYESENRLAKAAKIATLLALLIVFLGILGVVSLATSRKVKEIGIRKVLGASVPSIIFLFLKEFLLMIAFAIVLISPVVYWLMQHWLEAYPYRIELSVEFFVYVYVTLTFLVCILVSFQTIKAAVANPVKSLRSE
jgi:putative ABC transport system permease protein